MKESLRTRVLDAEVDCVDMPGALELVDSQIRYGEEPGTVLAVNPEKIYALRRNLFLRDFFSKAKILIPDGIGVVMALRLKGLRAERVPGADLMQEICALAERRGFRIFIYGAKEDVNRGAVDRLRERHPAIRIVGRANGFVTEEQMDALVEEINASKAQVLFVALGSPRQEEWMFKYLHRLETVRVCQGIGGTLDTIVGTVKRAPPFMQRCNLEWVYRLIQQPSRAGRQLRLLQFVFDVAIDSVRHSWVASRESKHR